MRTARTSPITRGRVARTAALSKIRFQTPVSAMSNENKLQIEELMSFGISLTNARKAIKLSREVNKNKIATIIQKGWRDYLQDRKKKLEAFKTDLQGYLNTNTNKVYYVSLIDKISTETPKILRDLDKYALYFGMFPTYVNFKNRVNRSIGPCHVVETNLPVDYLKKFINGLYFASNEYSKMSPVNKDKYMRRVVKEIGGRPCIENFLEAIQSSLYDENMNWLGRNITPLLFPARNQNKSKYLNVLAKATGSYMTNKKRAELKALPNNNARLQKFWNAVKNKQISVINQNGKAAFVLVSNYNRNGLVFKNSGDDAAAFITNYLN